jgi:hypothetical protein
MDVAEYEPPSRRSAGRRGPAPSSPGHDYPLVAAIAAPAGFRVLSAAETATFSVGNSRARTLLEEGFEGAEDPAAARGRTSSRTTVHLVVTIST